jgi:phage baseplate assembly protein V
MGEAKFGLVSSVDPTTATARILLQPDNTLTGWLPILSQWIGHGWGLASMPSPGDQVLILPQEGDIEHGVIMGGVYSAMQRPPQVPLGEFWIVHQSGCTLKLTNDGTVGIVGNLQVTGDIFDHTGSLAHLRTTFNTHTHQTSNNSTTSVPNTQDTTNV